MGLLVRTPLETSCSAQGIGTIQRNCRRSSHSWILCSTVLSWAQLAQVTEPEACAPSKARHLRQALGTSGAPGTETPHLELIIAKGRYGSS